MSLIVRTTPARLAGVRDALLALPGVDIHNASADTASGDGRLIVTVEDTAGSAVADVVMDIHHLEGVLSATLVFQYADDVRDARPADQPISRNRNETHHGSHQA